MNNMWITISGTNSFTTLNYLNLYNIMQLFLSGKIKQIYIHRTSYAIFKNHTNPLFKSAQHCSTVRLNKNNINNNSNTTINLLFIM